MFWILGWFYKDIWKIYLKYATVKSFIRNKHNRVRLYDVHIIYT
jgi:hypothetical protein